MAEPNGILNRAEMPKFDLLGLLLGGRGYAGQWFSQRDQLRLSENLRASEERARAAAAQGILADPAMIAAQQNPYDRQSQFSVWGAFQQPGVPESMANLGNDLLRTSVANIYDREGTAYADELAKARIKMTSDEQLRVDQVTRDREAQKQKDLMQALFVPDESGTAPIESDLRRRMIGDQMGIKIPEGFTIAPMENGQLGMRPMKGSKQWAETVAPMQAEQSLIGYADRMLQMLDTGEGNRGDWVATKQAMILEIKNAEKTGALDAGSVEFFDKTIPDYWNDFGQPWSIAKEQLRVFRNSRQMKLKQLSDQSFVPLDAVPNRTTYRDIKDISGLPPFDPVAAAKLRRDARERLEALPREPSAAERTQQGGIGTRGQYQRQAPPLLEYDPERQRKLRSR
jgi:hypothetical protein